MINLLAKAERDLRQIGPGPQRGRILAGLRDLDTGSGNLDIKALVGSAPWLRLRVGDYRVLYRDTDSTAGVVHVITRIVHRRELDRAVTTLPED